MQKLHINLNNSNIIDKVGVMMKALNWAKHCAQSQLISYAERRFSCESFSVAKRIGVNCRSELISVSLSVIRSEKPNKVRVVQQRAQ